MKKPILLLLLSYSLVLNGYEKANFHHHTDSIIKTLKGQIVLRSPASVRTKNDFDQSSLSGGEIEKRIARIIRGYASRNAYNYEIEVPLNRKKLRYLGYKNPGVLGFFTRRDMNRHLQKLNRRLHIYRYGKTYIFTPGQKSQDHLNVFHSVRALNIHRYRYPKIFKRYFTGLNTLPGTINRTHIKRPWINRTANTIIAFSSQRGIASSMYDIGYTRGRHFGLKIYHNNHIIYYNRRGICGKLSRYLYRKPDWRMNYAMYLREGIIESMLHERLHGYISARYSISPFLYYIRKHSRNYYAFEEPIINNTSISLLENRGGFSRRYISYYRWMFRNQIRRLGGNLSMYRRKLRHYRDISGSIPDRKLFLLQKIPENDNSRNQSINSGEAASVE